jgi:hypothetical protein
MNRCPYGTVCLASLLFAALAQHSQAVPPEEGQGTYFGVLFGPVTESLYDQLPQLPRKQGVLVTRVLADSPASTAGLHRHDILLTYDGQKVRDCEHLARLIRDDKPGRKLNVTYLRAGREASAAVQLGSGPALKLAEKPAVSEQRAANKPGGPASVSVVATPLDNGQLRVTIDYYPEGSGGPRTETWEGDPANLDAAARNLPDRERQLALRALDRCRTRNTSKTAPEHRPPS